MQVGSRDHRRPVDVWVVPLGQSLPFPLFQRVDVFRVVPLFMKYSFTLMRQLDTFFHVHFDFFALVELAPLVQSGKRVVVSERVFG
jgi:hypothetical protein